MKNIINKESGCDKHEVHGQAGRCVLTIIADCDCEGNFIAKSVSERFELAKVVLIEPFEVEVASNNLLRVLFVTHRLQHSKS